MIVTISGNLGAGKDTLASHLCTHHGFVKFSFAAAVKDNVARIFSWPRHLLEGDTQESREFRETVDDWWAEKLDMPDFTPRKILQEYATDVMRHHFHYDIWLLSLVRELESCKDDVVITDCRFLNEFWATHRMGSYSFGVYRKIDPGLQDFYTAIDNECCHVFGVPFMQVESNIASIREDLILIVESQGARYLKDYHKTDMQHLVWPNYEAIINNTGTIESSVDQLLTHLRKRGAIANDYS